MLRICFPLLLLACSLSVSAVAAPAWRLPVAVPAGCSVPGFELLLFDVSGSMARSGSFEPAQKDATSHVINGLPDCTLAVVASFGVTADVRGGEFLIDKASRRRVADSIAALRAAQGFTNLDEAAKLIELLDYQLRAAYSVPADRLMVRAYTDDQSAPSAGKSKFSLGEYLAQRMNARHMRVDGDALDVEFANTSRPQPLRTAKRPAHPGFEWMELAALRPYLAGALVVSFFALFGLRRIARSAVPPTAAALMEALLVAESDAQAHGPAANPNVREGRVDVLTRVPVVFSTDPDVGNYVASPYRVEWGASCSGLRRSPMARSRWKAGGPMRW